MSFISSLFKSAPTVNAGQYSPYTTSGLTAQQQLAKMLQDQIASGTSPEMQNAANAGMAQNASLLGSMHGISPTALTGALGQANARTQGQMAGIGAAGQLGREQLLGQTNQGIINPTLSYQQGANQQNLSAYQSQLGAATGLIGSAMNAAGGGLGFLSGGKGKSDSGGAAYGGEIDLRAEGGHVPGQAALPGDHPQNDTVPAKLSPGEIVVPRSVAQAADAPERAAAFVEAIKASGGKKPGKQTFADLLAKHRELDGRLKRIEKAFGGKVC